MLQVQDGCDEHCTYCIIPSVRGQSVSRPDKQIVEQARTMVAAGYRELALTGVHTGSYGYDVGNRNGLVDLLEALEQINGLDRIRLNSVEPAYVSDALIAFAARSDKFCRHFHIPLHGQIPCLRTAAPIQLIMLSAFIRLQRLCTVLSEQTS